MFWSHVVGGSGRPGGNGEHYASDPKFPMASIDSRITGQSSCSTSTQNSARSSFKVDWDQHRLSTTETTVLNPPAPETPLNAGDTFSTSLDSSLASFGSRTRMTRRRPLMTSTLISHKKSVKTIIDRSRKMKEWASYAGQTSHQQSNHPSYAETPTAEIKNPNTVVCRLRQTHEDFDQVDHPNANSVTELTLLNESNCEENQKLMTSTPRNNNPEPLHRVLNPLVGSQDPIDPFLIKVDIHAVQQNGDENKNGGNNIKDSEYVLMQINNNAANIQQQQASSMNISSPHDIISS